MTGRGCSSRSGQGRSCRRWSARSSKAARTWRSRATGPGSGGGGVAGFLQTLARLVVAGVPARLDRLAEGRSDRVLDLDRLPVGDGSPPPSATTWLVNGSRSRPIAQPEARRLGQSPALPMPEAPTTPKPAPLAAGIPAHRNGSTNGHHHPNHIGAPSNGKPMTPTSTNGTYPTPPLVTAPTSSDERVLAAFQETMRAFLDVQRSTMLAYLAGRSHAPAAAVVPAPPPPAAPIAMPEPLADRMTSRPPTPAPIKPAEASQARGRGRSGDAEWSRVGGRAAGGDCPRPDGVSRRDARARPRHGG